MKLMLLLVFLASNDRDRIYTIHIWDKNKETTTDINDVLINVRFSILCFFPSQEVDN